jgi:hypothetical protein
MLEVSDYEGNGWKVMLRFSSGLASGGFPGEPWL